jgi:hypothetical protein
MMLDRRRQRHNGDGLRCSHRFLRSDKCTTNMSSCTTSELIRDACRQNRTGSTWATSLTATLRAARGCYDDVNGCYFCASACHTT